MTSRLDKAALKTSSVLDTQVFRGTVNADDASTIQHIATLVAGWPAAPYTVISHRYPLDANRDLLLGQTSGFKNGLSFEAAS